MPLMIEELDTSLDVHDEAKLRKLVRQEIEEYMQRPRGLLRGRDVDAADPGAAGRPTGNGS